MNDIRAWLVDWFQARAPGSGVDAMTAENFFEVGLIDSFGVVELIGDLEERFAIRFDEANFQDARFATIDGLAAIVSQLVQEGGLA